MALNFLEHDTYGAMIDDCGALYNDAFTPITQSHYYGQTVLIKHNLRPRFFTIKDHDVTCGFFMLSDFYGLGGFYRRARLDRGPVWLKTPTQDDIKQCLKNLRHLMPKRIFHKTIFMPEIHHDIEQKTLKKIGWKHIKNSQAYETCHLDLQPSLQELRKNLKQKWRNSLNKSEKSDLTLITDDSLKYAKEFLLYYKRDKNYDGPSSQFLDLLMKKAHAEHALTVIRICKNKTVIAYALFLRHGNSATYQAAWQSNAGRSVNAGYLAVWSGIKYLKENHGTTHLDLGGLNREHASGLTRFKEGLNGKTIKLIGSYY